MPKSVPRIAISSVALACSVALVAPVRAAPVDSAAASSRPPETSGDWRAARWGMSVEEVLTAFPGEAFRLDPPLRLADGTVVAAGIDDHVMGPRAFRVRFVFETGKLALVSLRTPESKPADSEAYEQIEKLLTERLGSPAESSSDAEFIDMRQTRWNAGRSAVDLKYIPGVVVILWHPRAP